MGAGTPDGKRLAISRKKTKTSQVGISSETDVRWFVSSQVIINGYKGINYMIKSRIAFLFVFLLLTTSCFKYTQPSEVEGTWKSVKEDWTITTNGVKTSESYDYGGSPSELSAILRLWRSSFEIFTSSETRSLHMVYSDRFSPVDEKYSNRVLTTMTVTLKKNKLRGDGDAVWVVSSVRGKTMVIDYDSGVLEEDNADGTGTVEVRRKCRFVFGK